MRYKIENNYLLCNIDLHGADVKSLVRKSDGREMMWEGNPEYWNRTSPVLFPFVGVCDFCRVVNISVVSDISEYKYKRKQPKQL